MKNEFEPKNRGEEEIFAVENIIFDVQYELQRLMATRGITQKELAEKLGCSRARVSQLFSIRGANMTLETIGRILYALEAECSFAAVVLNERNHDSSVRHSDDRAVRAKPKHEFKYWALDQEPREMKSDEHATAQLAKMVTRLRRPIAFEVANDNSGPSTRAKSRVAM